MNLSPIYLFRFSFHNSKLLYQILREFLIRLDKFLKECAYKTSNLIEAVFIKNKLISISDEFIIPHEKNSVKLFLTCNYRQISQLIFNIFSFDKVQLTLDRTNWKWGKRDINILMLAIVYRGIAIPIVWTLLNKRGNSDTKERIALIQRFISIFGKDRIVNVFADREFIGEKWFTWLIENDINFCIRVKKTLL